MVKIGEMGGRSFPVGKDDRDLYLPEAMTVGNYGNITGKVKHLGKGPSRQAISEIAKSAGLPLGLCSVGVFQSVFLSSFFINLFLPVIILGCKKTFLLTLLFQKMAFCNNISLCLIPYYRRQ
jgi:hypothetical protein